MNKKLTIAPYTLMHYESKLDTYFFYNVKNDNFWETDKITGSIVAVLDGTLTIDGIVKLLHKDNPDIPIEDLQEHLDKTFEFLLKEGYVLEYTGKRPSYSCKQKEVIQTYEIEKKPVATSISDDDYNKYIRYYLDSIFNLPQTNKKTEFNYDRIHHSSMKRYIKEYSNDKNYLLSSPLVAFWNLTQACNFRCVHCLYNETEYSAKDDLSTEQALNLADELIESGIIFAGLTGGEVFLRPDAMNIIRKFKENNIAVHILTNGSLLTDEIIDKLAELFNPYTDAVQISLDAATDETFRKIRRSNKFDKINENIKKLTDKGLIVDNVCTINSINKDEIIDIYNLSKTLGARNFIVGKMDNYNDSHYNLNVSNRELFKIYYELGKISKYDKVKWPNLWESGELLNIPEVRKIVEESHYQKLIKKQNKESILTTDCQCHEKMAIQSDGRIYLCLTALNYNLAPLGTYKDNSLEEIWERRWDNMLYQPRNREKTECERCKYNTWCTGDCKVEAYVKSGDVNRPAISNCIACH